MLTKQLKDLLALQQEISEKQAELDDLHKDLENLTRRVYDHLPDAPYLDPVLFPEGWIVYRSSYHGELDIEFVEYQTAEDTQENAA